MMKWLQQVALAVDQLANALIGGMADETLSSHAWRSRDHRYWHWAYRFINWLWFWQDDHCRIAYENEKARKHMAKEFQ